MEQLTPTHFRSEYILLSRDLLNTDLLSYPLAFAIFVEIAATAWPGPTTDNGFAPGESLVILPDYSSRAKDCKDCQDALHWLAENEYISLRTSEGLPVARLTLKGELYISPGIDRGTAPTGSA